MKKKAKTLIYFELQEIFGENSGSCTILTWEVVLFLRSEAHGLKGRGGGSIVPDIHGESGHAALDKALEGGEGDGGEVAAPSPVGVAGAVGGGEVGLIAVIAVCEVGRRAAALHDRIFIACGGTLAGDAHSVAGDPVHSGAIGIEGCLVAIALAGGAEGGDGIGVGVFLFVARGGAEGEERRSGHKN